MRHKGDSLLRFLPFRNVLDDGDEVFGITLSVADNDAVGSVNTRATRRHLHLVFAVIEAAAAAKGFAVTIVDKFCGFVVIDVEYGLI